MIQYDVTAATTSPSSLLVLLSPRFLRFHNDGRMLDVFQRLTAKEGTYFLPQDLELSNQELSYIVKKAEQWRGFNGERRKVSIPAHCGLSCLSVVDSAPLLKPLEINWANGCFLNERTSQKVTDTNLPDWSVWLLATPGRYLLCCGTEGKGLILKGTLNGSHVDIKLFINSTFNLVIPTKILGPRGCIEQAHFISLHFL